MEPPNGTIDDQVAAALIRDDTKLKVAMNRELKLMQAEANADQGTTINIGEVRVLAQIKKFQYVYFIEQGIINHSDGIIALITRGSIETELQVVQHIKSKKAMLDEDSEDIVRTIVGKILTPPPQSNPEYLNYHIANLMVMLYKAESIDAQKAATATMLSNTFNSFLLRPDHETQLSSEHSGYGGGGGKRPRSQKIVKYRRVTKRRIKSRK
jgi:hypothetical protein